MNQLSSQFPNPGDTFAPSSLTTGSHSGLLTWLVSRPSNTIIQNAMLQDLTDRCEAQLAYNAMERVSQISAAEAQMSRDNPCAAGRFKAIADAYTMKLLYRMTGGDFDGR